MKCSCDSRARTACSRASKKPGARVAARSKANAEAALGQYLRPSEASRPGIAFPRELAAEMMWRGASFQGEPRRETRFQFSAGLERVVASGIGLLATVVPAMLRLAKQSIAFEVVDERL
jgi:hypothetical protein